MEKLIDVAHRVVPESTLESNERHAARDYHLLVNAHVTEPAGAAVIDADEPIVTPAGAANMFAEEQVAAVHRICSSRLAQVQPVELLEQLGVDALVGIDLEYPRAGR